MPDRSARTFSFASRVISGNDAMGRARRDLQARLPHKYCLSGMLLTSGRPSEMSRLGVEAT